MRFTEEWLLIYSGIVPISAVDCGPLPVPLNGSSTGDVTVFPNIVQFSCDSGFYLTGSIRRICQATGAWNGPETKCNR